MCSRTAASLQGLLSGNLFHKTTAGVVATVAALATQTLRISAAAVGDPAAEGVGDPAAAAVGDPADSAGAEGSGDTILESSTIRTTELTTTTVKKLIHPSSSSSLFISSPTTTSSGLSSTVPELGGEGIVESLSNISSTTLKSVDNLTEWVSPKDAMNDRPPAGPVIEWSTWVDSNSTEASTGDTSGSSSAVGVAIGVTIVCLLICLAIVLLVLFLVRRKRTKRKEKSIAKVENPVYRQSMDRRATTLEKSLGTAPTVNFQANSNKVSLPEGTNGSQQKQRGEAPAAPIYRPSKDGGMLVVGAKKPPPNRPPAPSDPTKRRHAPPAPPGAPLNITTNSSSTSNSDLYEKDSAHGSMEQVENLSPDMSSVNNPSAVTPPSRLLSPPTSPDNTLSNSPTEPLLSVNQKQAPPKPTRIITPRHTPPTSNVSSPRQRTSGGIRDSTGSHTKNDEKSRKEEEEETTRDDDDITDVETGLLSKTKNKKKTGSSVSLDSYDKTMNPFFADDY